MSDANTFSPTDTTQSGGWQAIKLRDLGDGSFAFAQTNLGAWDSTRISTISTTTIKTGAGILGAILVNKAVSASTITIYDNTAASGTVLAMITHPVSLFASQYYLPFLCKFSTGLTVVTTGLDDLTITYI